jgi:hypothetical protein
VNQFPLGASRSMLKHTIRPPKSSSASTCSGPSSMPGAANDENALGREVPGWCSPSETSPADARLFPATDVPTLSLR